MKIPRQEPKRARIEIIPMIDTIFFLLVFFMIASLSMLPMPAPRVALPASASADLKPMQKVVVTISKTGEFFVDRDAATDLGAMRVMLGSRLANDPQLVVVINCDKDQQIGSFVKVLDVVKQLNAVNVEVATSPQTPQELRP